MAHRLLTTSTFLLVLGLVTGASLATPPMKGASTAPLSVTMSQLQETNRPLDLSQAMEAMQQGLFRVSRQSTPTFGIGVRPVWIHLGLDQVGTSDLTRQLTIDVAWLDHVDLYMVHDGRVLTRLHMGDRLPQSQRPVPVRGFAADLSIPPGHSDVFIRVATPDPMVIPIRLQAIAQAQRSQRMEIATYGLFYGFLIALMAYNLMLWLGLRSSPYGLYALYLAMFIVMNLAYTGYGFELIWPNATGWEQWAPPTMMLLCASSGLLFAQRFLHTREHFPLLHRLVYAFIGSGLVFLAVAMLFGWQAQALLLAFAYVVIFTVFMLALGILSQRAGLKSSRFFLLAAACSMAGDATSALAVWGKIPYNTWTFRAAEIGMVLDATLLALALTYRFRRDEARRVQAEQLARLDPLTGMNNRRAFQDISQGIWDSALHDNRKLSVILLDIDHFKRVNDTHGHSGGDEVLKSLSSELRQAMREHDVIARWGGEEFIVLLPDTALGEAVAMAERLRREIASRIIHVQNSPVRITASFGVTERREGQNKLETLIVEADQLMYLAKSQGRNHVCSSTSGDDDPDTQAGNRPHARHRNLSGL